MKERFYSLDVFRGATVCLMIMVNNPGSWAHIYAPLRSFAMAWRYANRSRFSIFSFCRGKCICICNAAATNCRAFSFLEKGYQKNFINIHYRVVVKLDALCKMG